MTSPSDEGPELPRPPHEGRLQPQERQQRPMPCPECFSTRGYSPVGNYRVQCLGCNALLKNEEVDIQLSNEERR